MAAENLIIDASFWLNQQQVLESETNYYTSLTASQFGDAPCTEAQASSSLASEIEKARKQIKQSLNFESVGGVSDNQVLNRIATLEKENKELRQVTSDLQAAVKKLEAKISALEVGGSKPAQTAAKPAATKKEESDDDFDLFGSDDDDASDDDEAEALKQKRIKEYADRKSKKPQLIAKSNIILDVKPWDDETDMAELEKCVRSIEMDGLLWGSSKLVPVGYGIKKLQISCVVEDDKVSTDDLEDKITEFEDYIQSMDIAAFNKV